MKRIRVAALVFVWTVLSATATVALGQSSSKQTCQIEDADVYYKPSCVIHFRNGRAFVPKKYLRYQPFNENGLTALLVESFGAMYVNRNGRIVIRDVALIDNGPDDFHHGLVRILRDGKYGFSDASGRIVVPAQYPCALNYRDEYSDTGPTVCVNCRIEKQGEYSACLGGTWFRTDHEGHLTPTASPLEKRSDRRAR